MTSELAQHYPSFILLRFAAQGAVDIALRLDRLITLFLIQPIHGLIAINRCRRGELKDGGSFFCHEIRRYAQKGYEHKDEFIECCHRFHHQTEHTGHHVSWFTRACSLGRQEGDHKPKNCGLSS